MDEKQVTGGAPSEWGEPRGRAERPVGFLLIDTFGMLPFMAAVEALRAANRYSRQTLYSWHVFSVDGRPVRATNGMPVEAEASIRDVERFPTAIVCGPHDPREYRDEAVFGWLRQLARAGAEIGAVDTGTYLLARARVLEGRRCTIHWENAPGFREEFPDLVVSSELFEIDQRRLTCGGGTAALDMMLTIIARQHGRRLANAVSELFLHDNIRGGGSLQRMSARSRLGVAHPGLLRCVELMEANLESPLLPAELASFVGLSKRQLERLFRRYLRTTPSRYYMELRLAHGRRLLEQTALPVIDVAVACGFTSPGHFSHRYRSLFGRSPRESRGGD